MWDIRHHSVDPLIIRVTLSVKHLYRGTPTPANIWRTIAARRCGAANHLACSLSRRGGFKTDFWSVFDVADSSNDSDDGLMMVALWPRSMQATSNRRGFLVDNTHIALTRSALLAARCLRWSVPPRDPRSGTSWYGRRRTPYALVNDLPSITQLFGEADDTLFRSILTNKHVLRTVLFTWKTKHFL